MPHNRDKAPVPVGPLIIFLFPFIAGVVTGAKGSYLLPLSASTDNIPIFLAFLLFFLLLSFLFYKRTAQFPIFLICMAGIFLVAGNLHYRLWIKNFKARASALAELADARGKHVLTAQIIRAPVEKNEKLHLVVTPLILHLPDGKEHPLTGTLSLTLPPGAGRMWAAGDLIRFAAVLKRVRNFKTPGSFDYENWWALRDIAVKAFVSSPVLVVKTGHAESGPGMSHLRCIMENGRQFLMKSVEEVFGKGSRYAAVASALLFGTRTGMEPELAQAFSHTGTGHLLAVSGLHMAIITLLLYQSVRWLLLRSERVALRIPVLKLSCMVSIAGVVLYAAMAGFSPSATRAMVMILLFMLAFVCERPASPLNTLAAAAWFLLLYSPLYLFDMSFQLSFIAVAFLILFAPIFRPSFMPKGGFTNRAAEYALSLSAVSVVAAAATAPVIAWYFQTVSAAGLILNIVLVPLVCFVLLPLLISGAVTAWVLPGLSALLWQISEPFMDFLSHIVSHASLLPGSWFYVPRPALSDIELFYLLLFGVALLIRGAVKRKRLLLGFAAVIALILPLKVVVRYHLLSKRDELILHVLDVGQGLCQVVELPFGKLMVADAGGMRKSTFDTGSRIVGPFIRCLGYTHIDILTLSHAECDHAGGLPSLIMDFHPARVWLPDERDADNPWMTKIYRAISEAGSKHEIIAERISKDRAVGFRGGEIRIFTPQGCRCGKSRNSRSLLFEIEGAGGKLLLTGDIDTCREACFTEKMHGMCSVVTVPHHGSRTSSSIKFVRQLRPRVAIISAGWRNYLNLPVPEVVRRWEEAGAGVFVTGEDGTVTVRFVQGAMKVSLFANREGLFYKP